MTIGTSLGAFYPDKMSFLTSPYKDNNVIDPDTTPDLSGSDSIDREKPNDPPVEVQVGKKDEMPFPDNTNPDANFVNRFGNLPPSGILNDLKKPTGDTVPLVRKINMSMGDRYVNKSNIQELPFEETVSKAALQYKGELFEGKNHGFALGDIMDKHPDIDLKDWQKDIKEGFTTSHGRFISREEAFDMARDKGQIDPKVLPALTADSKMLLSEDLSGP